MQDPNLGRCLSFLHQPVSLVLGTGNCFLMTALQNMNSVFTVASTNYYYEAP